MLRLHFTVNDLARVHIANELDPLWETTLGLQQLTAAPRSPAMAVVRKRGLTGSVRLLAALVPNKGYFPDFLTPPDAARGLADGLEAVRATAPGRLRQEVRRMVDSTTPPPPWLPWLRDLALGDRDRMTDLTAALRAVHDLLTASELEHAGELAEDDRCRRRTLLREHGTHGLLRSLTPFVHWEPPVLHVSYPVDRDVHLAGRGLRLVPSYFCRNVPIALADPGLAPVLIYPLQGGDRNATPASLVNLLGRTRARVLVALRETSTTGELASLLRVSPASASEHIHVLHAADLVCSQRKGNRVLHTLTPLGAALLDPVTRPGTWSRCPSR